MNHLDRSETKGDGSEDRLRCPPSLRRVRIGRYLLLLALFLPVSSLGQTPPSPPPALIQDGKTVYASNCSGCHGADTFGTDHAPKLTGQSRCAQAFGRAAAQSSSIWNSRRRHACVCIPASTAARCDHGLCPFAQLSGIAGDCSRRRGALGGNSSGARAIAESATWFTAEDRPRGRIYRMWAAG